MADKGEGVAITKEELVQIVEETECTGPMKTCLRRLVGSFPSVESFRHADDAELRRHGRCGALMMDLVTKVRDRCYFLEKNREERFRYNESFREYLDERRQALPQLRAEQISARPCQKQDDKQPDPALFQQKYRRKQRCREETRKQQPHRVDRDGKRRDHAEAQPDR